MKCVKQKGTVDASYIIRVPNDKAAKMVESGKWEYTNKGAWKSNGRQRKD